MTLAEQEPQTKYYAECSTLISNTLKRCSWKSDVFLSDSEAYQALMAHIQETHPEPTSKPYGYVRYAPPSS